MASYTVKRQDGPHVEEKPFVCAKEAIAFLEAFVEGEEMPAEESEEDETVEAEEEEEVEPEETEKEEKKK